MNIFLFIKTFKPKKYNNSNKITKKSNHKKLIKQTKNQKNDNNNVKKKMERFIIGRPISQVFNQEIKSKILFQLHNENVIIKII